MGIVYDDFSISIEAEAVLKALALDADDLEEVQPFIDRSRAVARPLAMIRTVPVGERDEQGVCLEGVRLVSGILSQQLEGCAQVTVYMVTCGVELQQLSAQTEDSIERFWQDTINEMVLAQASSQLHERLQREAGATLYSINPGSLREWTIRELNKLFEILGDVREETGVYLTPSSLMMPVKSVCGIYFHGAKEYVNCQLCPREHCPNRRAPYEEWAHA